MRLWEKYLTLKRMVEEWEVRLEGNGFLALEATFTFVRKFSLDVRLTFDLANEWMNMTK